jgi:hypothetical protein
MEVEATQREFNFIDDINIDINEELTPLIVDGISMKEYSISKSGNVYSHLQSIRRPNSNRGFDTIYNPNYKKLLTPDIKKDGYKCVRINFDSGTFDYNYYCNSSSITNRQRRSCRVHRLVIDSWKPFDQNLPDEINKTDYENTPESIKTLLKDLFLVNHIDHDRSNNNLENLERVTHKQNSRLATQYYSVGNE